MSITPRITTRWEKEPGRVEVLLPPSLEGTSDSEAPSPVSSRTRSRQMKSKKRVMVYEDDVEEDPVSDMKDWMVVKLMIWTTKAAAVAARQ